MASLLPFRGKVFLLGLDSVFWLTALNLQIPIGYQEQNQDLPNQEILAPLSPIQTREFFLGPIHLTEPRRVTEWCYVQS